MKPILALIIVTATAFAACPTSTDSSGVSWVNTCFVSNSGNDSTGTGTWSAPKKTVTGAWALVGTNNGDTIVLRGGRYRNGIDDGLNEPAAKCNAASPCTIRSYPGEVVIIDGSSWSSNRGWFHGSFGSSSDVPPWSNDTQAGYFHISGIRFENFPTVVWWAQGDTDGIEMRTVRVYGPGGIAFQKCTDCKILGSQFDIHGWHRTAGGQSVGLACSGVSPSYGRVPYAVLNQQYFITYWDLVNVAPVTTTISPNSCVDLLVQDSAFNKPNMSGSDLVGMESSTRLTFERVKFRAAWDQANNITWALWGGEGTDSTDIKGIDFRARDIEVRGGKAGLKMWTSANVDRVLTLTSYQTAETGFTGMSFIYQSAGINYEWPAPVSYRTVRYVYNDPLTNDAVVVLSRIGAGIGGMVDLPVTFSEIPGCTGINGNKLVKRLYHGIGYPHVFAIKNMDGSRFSCPDAYGLNQHVFRTYTGLATTFAAGTTDATVTGMAVPVYMHDRIKFSTTGSLPAEVTPDAHYWITYRSGTTVRLSATRGGTPITFSGAGSGTHSATVTDEKTSYAGKMVLQPYTVAMNHVSALGRTRGAMDLCGGCDAATPSNTWSINNSVAAIFNGTHQVTQTLIVTAKPRVFFTASSPSISYEYNDDAGTLAVNASVYFHATCALPAQFAEGTPYYIKSIDTAAKTMQVSATVGGSAITPSTAGCGSPRYFMTSPGFRSTKVSLGNTSIAAGDTFVVAADDGATPVYPLAKGSSYYVSSIATGAVGGTTFRWAELKYHPSDVSPISFSQYPMVPNTYLEKDVDVGGSPSRVTELSSYTTVAPSGNNWYWSSQTDRAFCMVSHTNGGTDIQGTCAANQSVLNGQESGSTLAGANPALDYGWTGRATASTPATMWNKGYYAGTDSTEVGSTEAVLRWRAPEATDNCSVTIATNSVFSAVHATLASPPGPRWRTMLSTGLSPSTPYWYKIQCGYDVMTGGLATTAAVAGSGTLTLDLPSEAGSTAAVLESSADGTQWSSGPTTNCAAGCSLSTVGLARNRAHWYRWKRLNGGGETVQQSDPMAAVVR